MAQAQQSLLKNSSSIGTIQDSLNAFGKSLRVANSTSSGIIRQLYQGNRDKKSAILKQRELFQKRREAVQKREREDVVEAGKVGSVFRRSSNVISGSTKGFLGRIMDFVGTIMVGWLVTNLPRIIKGAEELIGRIQNLIGVLTSWTDGLANFFSDFTSQLGTVLGRITGLSFDADKKTANASESELETGVNKMLNDMEQMITNLLGFDLLALLGLKSSVDATQPPGADTYESSGYEEDVAPGSYPRGVYDAKKLTQLARSVGMPDDKIPTMVAIALAESSGKTDAHNPVPPDNSYGLWQINMIGSLGPARRKEYGLKSNEELKDPRTNAKAALAVLKSQGLTAWSVYKSGAYKKHIGRARAAYEQVKSQPRTAPPGPAPKIDSGTSYRRGQDVSSIVGAPAKITSVKGEMRKKGPHGGIDIACDSGLYISLRGVDAEVVATQSGGGYGLVIDIWVPSLGVQLRFAHNSRILIKSGKIPAGTSFAVTGNTGRSTGPHIHLEADTKRGSSTYGGNTSPNPYVALIRLTRGKIEGVKSEAPVKLEGKGGPTLEPMPDKKEVAGKVTPERTGRTIPVPIPTGGTGASQPPSGGGGSSAPPVFFGGGDQLNSFVTQTLLRELEYT